ncbi:MAG: hypothetical protein ACREUA_07480 [Burkholderiales bacterium]
MKRHYWYSIKQKDAQMAKYGWRYAATFARFPGGRVNEYTMTAALGSPPPEIQADTVYLGVGQFDHIEDMQTLLRMS